ncbi:MAG: zinc dependent phospholipase C family protein [Tissierellia bacterium]|nr:zinc dependent phospholipase C family protein [Tissierellia bacterium]
MVLIFAETHKQIASNINKEISRIYNIELDEKKLLWGSVVPDYNPKYKIHRHYADESLDFIVNEINVLIFLGRFIDIENEIFDGLSKKLFSRKLGIISHYLADFVCRPHYDRLTFNEAMIQHVKYEKNLNQLAENFEFKNNGISCVELKTADDGFYKIKPIIKEYTLNVLDEYSVEISPERDLEFAYNLNLKMFYFVLDTIKLFNCEKSIEKAFLF